MLTLDRKIRSLVENTQYVSFVVLTAKAKELTCVHLINHELLQRAIRGAHINTQWTNFCADSFPKCVVKSSTIALSGVLVRLKIVLNIAVPTAAYQSVV